MTITGQAAGPPLSLAAQAPGPDEAATITAQALGHPGLPVPDDPVAVSMFTAHRLDDVARHLAHASERLRVACQASGGLRAYHCGHVARHLSGALDAGHLLSGNLRDRYPAEGAELDKTTEVIGMARALSQDARSATTAHLVQTILYDCGHAQRHAQAMLDEPEPDGLWAFNAGHCGKHLAGAAEHARKLKQHFADNYPAEAKWLAGLEKAASGDGEGRHHGGYAKDGGTVSAQLANRGYELNPRSGMISLDLPPGAITPVPGGVQEFHVTVVYLGPDVDDDAFAAACDRAKAAAAAVPGPLAGMVGGIGTFPPSDGSDGKIPVWAGVVLPGSERIRDALEDLSASEHATWQPHVTLAYVDPGDPLPPPAPSMQVSFTHLSVHRGDDEVERYPLGGQ